MYVRVCACACAIRYCIHTLKHTKGKDVYEKYGARVFVRVCEKERWRGGDTRLVRRGGREKETRREKKQRMKEMIIHRRIQPTGGEIVFLEDSIEVFA